MKEILALIPARGGSKGLPGKNILPLAGKPLLAYTIDSARRCPLITRVIVSTDSPAIADVALRHGADVPFLRPTQLAGDKASVGQALADTIHRLAHDENYVPDITLDLFPTSPFRNDGLVRFLVERLLEGYSSVCTARAMNTGGRALFLAEPGGCLRPLIERAPAPALAPLRRYGLVSGVNSKGTLGPYVYRIDDPVLCIDIDTPQDFRLAEAVMAAGLFDFSLAADRPAPPRASRPPAPSSLELALSVRTLGRHPVEERRADRDTLRDMLGLGRGCLCRELGDRLERPAPDVTSHALGVDLERLARLDPAAPILIEVFDRAMTAAEQSTPLPDGPVGLVAGLFRQPKQGRGRQLDNLLAAMGMAANRSKRFGQGLPLFAVTRWQRVRNAPYYLDRFFTLMPLGIVGESAAARMVRGLAAGAGEELTNDAGLLETFGLCHGWIGQGEVAERLIVPRLEQAMGTPDRLFPLLSAFLLSRRQAVGRQFLQRHRAELAGLNYDANQRAILASFLLRFGLPAAARDMMTHAVWQQGCPTDASLCYSVHGLVRVGRTKMAKRLLNDFARRTGTLASRLALAQAYLSAGQPRAARTLLETVDIDTLDSPLIQATCLELFERAQAVNQLLTLGKRCYSSSALPGPKDWPQHLTLALHRHELPALLDRAKDAHNRFDDDPGLLQGLHQIALWAGDTATALETAARMSLAPGIYPGHAWEAVATSLLLQGQVEAALPMLQKRRDLATFQAMHLNGCFDVWEPFFAQAQALRLTERPREALAVVEDGIRLEATPHNPCRGLRRLLEHILAIRPIKSADISFFVRLGDAQTAPRSLIGPWLHVQAIRLAKSLGAHTMAAHIARTRLSGWTILDPAARNTLADMSLDRPEVSCADFAEFVQMAFYPYYAASYWNDVLAADLEAI